MDPYWMRAAGWDDVPFTIEEMDAFMRDIQTVLDTGIRVDGQPYTMTPDHADFPMISVLGFRSLNGMSTMSNVTTTAFTGTLISVDRPWGAPDNRTVENMMHHPGYRANFRLWRDWWRDGLLDRDMFTMEPVTANSRKNHSQYAMFSGSATPLANTAPHLVRDPFPDRIEDGWIAGSIRPMTSRYNDRRLLNFELIASINTSMITDRMENPALYARWLDAFYNTTGDFRDNSDPAAINFQLGFYGEHFEVFGDNNEFWRFLRARGDGEIEAATGLPARIDWVYARNNIAMGWNMPGGINVNPWMDLGAPAFIGKQIATIANQYPYCTTDTQVPVDLLRVPEADQRRVGIIRADLALLIEEAWANFMTGVWDIDNDAQWQSFIDNAYRAGMAEITAIYQVAYDVWVAAIS
jgi:hypothetical protein